MVPASVSSYSHLSCVMEEAREFHQHLNLIQKKNMSAKATENIINILKHYLQICYLLFTFCKCHNECGFLFLCLFKLRANKKMSQINKTLQIDYESATQDTHSKPALSETLQMISGPEGN